MVHVFGMVDCLVLNFQSVDYPVSDFQSIEYCASNFQIEREKICEGEWVQMQVLGTIF